MKILGFDFETTSPKPETADVVQMGAMLVNEDGSTEVIFNQLCKPEVDITDGAAEIHGITKEMVADAEPSRIAVKRLHEYVMDNKDDMILLGHNIVTFDIPILERFGGARIGVKWIDTLVSAIRVFPEAESHKLGDLAQWLQIGGHENAHDAMADIGMVAGIAQHLRQGLMKSWPELSEWCMSPRILKRCHFGKHKGKLWGRPPLGANPKLYVPGGYVRTVICDKFDPTPDLEATIRYHYRMSFKKRRRY